MSVARAFGCLWLLALGACTTGFPADDPDPGGAAGDGKADTGGGAAVLEPFYEACRRLEPEGATAQYRASLCTCLEGRADLSAADREALCRPGGRLDGWLDHLGARSLAEGRIALATGTGAPVTAKANGCLEQMIELNRELLLDTMTRACEEETDPARLRSLLDLPATEPADGACFTLRRMTSDGCIESTPCDGGASATLCHDGLQRIHRLKDPDDANHHYNFAYLNFLTWGANSPRISFGPANCHGTAQAIAGDFLAATPLQKITYHSPTVREECTAWAEAEWSAAIARSGEPFPRARDLPIQNGGHVINMDHATTSGPEQCGSPELMVFSCDAARPVAYAFHLDMSASCWGAAHAARGYTDVSHRWDWRRLVPGCVLTANDHSVTLLAQSEGMCFFYEATSPFGAPQLRTEPCALLERRFPRRACPAVPLVLHRGGHSM